MNKNKIFRIIKLFISMIYFVLYQITLLVYRLFNRQFPGTFVVLYYHEIKSKYKDNFARQMAILSTLTPIRADNISIVNGEHRVAVTFDDAFQSIIENGIEAIYKYKIPITIFVPTSYMGKYPEWEFYNDRETNEELIMTREHITNLSQELVMLGSHTSIHPDLTKLNDKEIERELKNSKQDLEDLLGKEICLLAFPYGKYNDKIVMKALTAGYRYVYTILPQFPKQHLNNAIIGRTPTNPYDWNIEFRLKIAGYYCWLSFPGHLKHFFKRLIVKFVR